MTNALDLLYGNAPVPNFSAEQTKADAIAAEFIATLNDWHARPEKWDAELDKQIHAWYARPPKVWPSKPYFSPSASSNCPRELYEKAIGSKRDEGGQQPHQKRWTNLGTAIGDMIQRDLLFIGKHMPESAFKFAFNEDGTPLLEDFSARNVPVKIGDEAFNLYGMCDGIMEYTDHETGEIIRVGLEIKSKQTTPARTSLASMKEAEEKHVAQCTLYSLMYGVDYYVIIYVNAAKKAWTMTDEDFEKTPDIRAFGFHFTDADRGAILEPLAEVRRAVREENPPAVDLSKFTFNGFKEAIARSLTDDEMQALASQVELAKKSSMKPFIVRGYEEGYAKLEELRK